MVRIGVMNDMAGVYSDDQGPGSVLAAQLAVEDHGSQAAGRKVEVVSADHQNKTDLGAAIARRWVENEGVNMIADLPNSAIALAVNEVVRDHNRVMLASGAGTALLTGGKCSPNTIHWTYDTWAYGHVLRARWRNRVSRASTSSPPIMPSAMTWRSSSQTSS
jgi:branched-chain amino acid transport system substrate-binding protein